ncbi:hypothetical protein Mapa_000049 [Marchantia paleacea]|nr:hypothetical protein Mapa_000049 [Marchantia paleacea]
MGRTAQSSVLLSLIYVLLLLVWSGHTAGAAAARHELAQNASGPSVAVVGEDGGAVVPTQKRLPVISIVVGVISAVIAVFFLALTAMGYFQNRCEEKARGSQRRRLCPAPAAAGGAAGTIQGGRQPDKYSLRELQAATVSFTQKLGRGGCGAVFKGILSNSKEVAVKLVDDYTPGEFEVEVRRVSSLHHDNLMQIYGYCTDGDHCLLVQEYYANGSLRSFLYSTTSSSGGSNSCHNNNKLLNWSARLNISLGTAKALSYVHGVCRSGFNIHGRIKPENVLLSDNLNPRLADFGFVRCRRKRDHDLTLATAQGTLEYFAPEWWSDPSPKCDVYSFGILLLEIIGGRRIGDFYDRPQWEFPDLDKQSEGEGESGQGQGLESGVTELLDPELKGKVDLVQLRVALQVAYWCIQYEARARPSMAQVVDYLEGRVQVSCPPTPSSSAIFTPLHLSYSASLEAFGFRGGNGVEIVNAR